MLPMMTIDGEDTLDFDDALSFEDKGDHYSLGIHIADVAHYIKKGDILDQEAFARASSIYMPDQKIPMLPASLSEDLCSLKGGEVRPAVSTMIRLTPFAEIIDYEVFPSLICIKKQLTYQEVDLMKNENKDISTLYDIAKEFRSKRLSDGAVQISLPEINIWLEKDGQLVLERTDMESPARMLIAETMIMANWLTAKFLAEHHLPAIYRSQADPKGRLYDGEGSLFQNWMQRKLLSRFVLGHEPERHAGLGLSAYVTATSPIRKYTDLVTQRQIRAVFGLETPYTDEEIDHIIQMIDDSLRNVSRIQFMRKRYWLLKYLENKIGEKKEAVVLGKRKNSYPILIPEYMTECDLPMSSGISLKPEDMIQIKIQHVSARKDAFSVFMG